MCDLAAGWFFLAGSCVKWFRPGAESAGRGGRTIKTLRYCTMKKIALFHPDDNHLDFFQPNVLPVKVHYCLNSFSLFV